MSVTVIVGAQWGDEGKGKIVDFCAKDADVVVRYAGGANAGHTLVNDGAKHVFHLLPSGALHPKARIFLAHGTVIDMDVLLREITLLETTTQFQRSRLLISDRAHVVLPHHKVVDEVRDQGTDAIGTTRRGIGPAYEDKIARRGVRVRDTLNPEHLRTLLVRNISAWEPLLRSAGRALPDIEDLLALCLEQGAELRPHIGDTSRALFEAVSGGQRILLEGAQGTLLDIDCGTYPYVTSSSTTAGGACTGTGLGPTFIERVIGITKAYTTRVGAGPFPTELFGMEGESLRESGDEYGATTGRARRCGWLDLPALRYAIQVNGITDLALTKLDVLSGLKEIPICVSYELEGERIAHLPCESLDSVKPIYEVLPGWDEDITHCRALEQLPSQARDYIAFIQERVGCEFASISVGPDRAQSIVLKGAFR
ncbi:MAG: adenylosuccinate synthase [Myxococcales bacterium]|nr:adenylosuccinate synthase [Myxococcales bacterium]